MDLIKNPDIDYFKHPALSNSKLGWYKQSPKHYKYFQEHGKEDRPAYLIGSATHTVLFEPELFKGIYHVVDESQRPFPDKDFRKAENKIWLSDITEAYSHKKIITLEEYDMIMFMMEELQDNNQAVEILKGAKYEQEVFWTDPETKLECKKKIDIQGQGYKGDYKTADNADPFLWQRKAWGMDYYRQAGFYSLTDSIESPEPFWFIVQEKKAPYAVSVHLCTQEMINYGKDEAMKLMKQLLACKNADYWPSYEIKTPVDKKQEYFDFDIPGWVLQHQ